MKSSSARPRRLSSGELKGLQEAEKTAVGHNEPARSSCTSRALRDITGSMSRTKRGAGGMAFAMGSEDARPARLDAWGGSGGQ